MQVTKIEMLFLPALLTKDDPLRQRAYFGWKAMIGPRSGEEKQYGKIHELPGGDYRDEFDKGQRQKWTLVALEEIEDARRALVAGKPVNAESLPQRAF